MKIKYIYQFDQTAQQNNLKPTDPGKAIKLGQLVFITLQIIMADNEHLPALTGTNIRWGRCNYPPLIKVMHFVPSEIPKRKKFIVYSLLLIHLILFLNSILNFIDNCAQGGIRILYSFFFLLFINPFLLLIFYRGFTGICKDEGNLQMYIFLQPVAIALEILVSIISIFGFNGFVRAHSLFNEGNNMTGVLSVIVALIFLLLGVYSGFIYFRVLKERVELTSDLTV